MVPMRTMEESDACMRARLVESLSQSFPGSALSKALMITDDSNSTSDMDNLSNSCFAEIRLDKIKQEPVEEDEDEELKSLTWLQDSDLLKNIGPDDCTLCTSPIDDLQKENNDMNGTGYPGQTHPPHVPYNPQKHVNSKPPYSFSCLIFMSIEDSPIKKLPVKDIYNWILTHFPYFQNAPTGWKNSVRHNLSLNKCFKKVEKEKGHGIGKGSLWCIDPDYRPNLLQALRKTPYHPYHQLQMLSTPQPSVSYDYSVHGVLPINGRPVPFAPRLNINTPSPRLFPFLSKRLGGLDPSASNIEADIDVANTLVSLKQAAESRRPLKCQRNWSSTGARSRSPSPPEFGSEREKQIIRFGRRALPPKKSVVLTSRPSSDHTYSITKAQLREVMGSPNSSIDEEYEFGSEHQSDIEMSEHEPDDDEDIDEDDMSDDELLTRAQMDVRRKFRLAVAQTSTSRKRLHEDDEDDEALKIAEGADALLNLAGFCANLRPVIKIKDRVASTSSRSVSPNSTAYNNNNNKEVVNGVTIKQEPIDPDDSPSPAQTKPFLGGASIKKEK